MRIYSVIVFFLFCFFPFQTKSMERLQKERVVKLIESVSFSNIEQAISEIKKLSNKKVQDQHIENAYWSTSIYENNQRSDFVYELIEQNPEIFLSVIQALADHYVFEVKKSGRFYVSAIQANPSRVQKLLHCGALKNNENVQAYINRYEKVGKYKIFIGDILDIYKVAEEFSLSDTQIQKIKNSSKEDIFINSLYGSKQELESEIDMCFDPAIKKEMKAFLTSLQTKAVANILTILRYNELSNSLMDLDDLLLFVHAAWCLDNPGQYQTKLPFSHLSFEEVKKDWDVLKVVLENIPYNFGLDAQVEEGKRRFNR